MAGISLATTAFEKIALGSTEIETISLGTTEIWTASTVTVEFDEVSAVGQGTGDTNLSITPSANSTVLVALMQLGNNTMAAVTYGASAMTHVASVALNNTSSTGWLRVYSISGVGGSTATITLDKNGTNWIRGYAVAYQNVGSIGAPATAFGSGTSASHNVSAPPTRGRVFQAFGFDQNRTITPSGGTSLVAYNNTGGSISGSDHDDAATFAASLSGTSSWASIAVPLSPA